MNHCCVNDIYMIIVSTLNIPDTLTMLSWSSKMFSHLRSLGERLTLHFLNKVLSSFSLNLTLFFSFYEEEFHAVLLKSWHISFSHPITFPLSFWKSWIIEVSIYHRYQNFVRISHSLFLVHFRKHDVFVLSASLTSFTHGICDRFPAYQNMNTAHLTYAQHSSGDSVPHPRPAV